MNFGTEDVDFFTSAQEAVVAEGNPYFCFRFAGLPGADVLRLGGVVIESGDAELNKKFAKHRDADVVAHAKIVIESGDIMMNYKFAKDVSGCDVAAHGKVIIDSEDVNLNKKFVKLPGADIAEHQKKFRYSDDVVQAREKSEIKLIIDEK